MKTAYIASPVGVLEVTGDVKGLASVTFMDASEEISLKEQSFKKRYGNNCKKFPLGKPSPTNKWRIVWEIQKQFARLLPQTEKILSLSSFHVIE